MEWVYLFTVSSRSNESIGLKNSCHEKSPDGNLESIKGYVYRPNNTEQGKLKLHLDGIITAMDCK